MVPLVVLMFWIGVYPGTFLEKTEASVKHVISQVQARQIEGSSKAFATVGTEISREDK
jgi:NADH-quinone oxidoreductase subunit M